MDLAGLRTFLTVAAERSFSRAAAKLHRSQPAVSLAIRRLEDELGEPLFDRTSRGAKLTPAGQVLEIYGVRVLQLVEETTEAVRNARRARPATLTVGGEPWMLAALGPLLDAFRAAHEDVHVDLRIRRPASRRGRAACRAPDGTDGTEGTPPAALDAARSVSVSAGSPIRQRGLGTPLA